MKILALLLMVASSGVLTNSAGAASCVADCRVSCFGVRDRVTFTQLDILYGSVSEYRKFCRDQFDGSLRFNPSKSFVACVAHGVQHVYEDIFVTGFDYVTDSFCRDIKMFKRFRGRCKSLATKIWSGWDIDDCLGDHSVWVNDIEAVN